MNNTVPVLFHIFHVFFSYCNICHRNKRYCDVIQNVFIEGIWINLEGRIIASCFDLLDGEGHVRCESWPHPDPRAHPHHDRPGELLLPGGCLQCLAVSGEHPNRFQICEQQAPKFKKKKCLFCLFRRMTSSLSQFSTWWWVEGAPFLQEDQAKACSPACTWTCSTGERLSNLNSASFQLKESIKFNSIQMAVLLIALWSFVGTIGCTMLPPTTIAMRTVVCCVSMPVQTPDRLW